MKIFGKWLVYGKVNGKARIACNGFNTKKEAIQALSMAGFKRLNDNLWEDSLGQQFFIEKNTKEY